MAVGLAVLLGWAIDSPTLKSVSSSFPPMKPNTALALTLAGVAVALVRPVRRSRWRSVGGAVLAGVVMTIGLLTLSEYAFGWDLRIDGLLFEVAQEVPEPSLRRMGVNTAFGFVACGTAIMLLARGRAIVVSQLCALATALVALVSLLGYIYAATLLQEGFFANVSRMALHTALALLTLATAILLLRPGVGLMSVALGDDAGAVMFRRLLPAAILVPVVVGWLRLEGEQAGFYHTEIGVALFVGSLIAAMSLLIWVTARSLQRADRERKRAEQEHARLTTQLSDAQRLEALGRLAGGVAHDFNNLLGVIGGFARHAQDSAEPGNARAVDLAEIIKASDRAADLTRQLLAFSRAQEVRTRPLDLNEVVRGLERMLRRLIGEDLEFEVSLGEGLPPIEFDRSQLEQAIVNLVANAREAMPGGGRVEIATSLLELRDATTFTRRLEPGRYVALSVADTGHGIDPDVASQVFDPFFTTKGAQGGTGLGLAMVYGVVDRANGAIGIETEPGRGTRFVLYLPTAAQALSAPEPAAPPQRSSEAAGGGETILVAEDEASFRLLVRVVLTEAGYRVLEAADGEDALRVAEAYDAPIDLLLTDAVMPRLGGNDLIRRLREVRPGTRALQMTGYSDRHFRDEEPAARPDDVIHKPFEPDALLLRVRQLLDAEEDVLVLSGERGNRRSPSPLDESFGD